MFDRRSAIPGGARRGKRAAAPSLGAEQNRAGADRLGQRRGWHWQIGPGGGATGRGPRRGVATHCLSLFALPHYQCPLSCADLSRTLATFRTKRSSYNQARQIGGKAADLWLATS